MHAHAITTEGSRYHMHHRAAGPFRPFDSNLNLNFEMDFHEKAPTQFPPSLLISFSILQSPLIDGSMNNFKNSIKERVVLQQIVLFTISSRYGCCRSVTSFVELQTDDQFCSHLQGIPHVSERRGQRYLEEVVTFLIYTNSSRTNS